MTGLNSKDKKIAYGLLILPLITVFVPYLRWIGFIFALWLLYLVVGNYEVLLMSNAFTRIMEGKNVR